MRHTDFDGRLDGIMVRAAVRLHERMAFAFARGSLADYLRKIGMAEELGLGPQHNANLAKIEDAVLILLAQKIRRARKSGTLKSYLRQINMLEPPARTNSSRSRTARSRSSKPWSSNSSPLRTRRQSPNNLICALPGA